MSTISLRVSDEEATLIKEYVKINNISLSKFLKDLALDAIENDLQLDEARILAARKRLHEEEASDHEDVWKRLGV